MPDSFGETLGDALSVLLDFDRSGQWSTLVRECRTGDSVLFLLHGHSRQSMGLFLDRMGSWLQGGARPMEIVSVPRIVGHQRAATTAREWSMNVRTALSVAPPYRNSGDVLRAKSVNSELLLVLGDRPLSGLTDPERDGLVEFVSQYVPTLIAACTGAPLRFFVGIEHGDEPDPVIARLEAAALEVEDREDGEAPLRVVNLPALDFPSERDLDLFLANYRSPPPTRARLPAARRLALRQLYAELLREPDITFRRVCDVLDRAVLDRAGLDGAGLARETTR